MVPYFGKSFFGTEDNSAGIQAGGAKRGIARAAGYFSRAYPGYTGGAADSLLSSAF